MKLWQLIKYLDLYWFYLVWYFYKKII